ncbi:MAG: hypothetical protein JNL83_10765 [Myxococcales bacterium]|nr:hypothetical protein [Myxococcales bacterium]
MSGPKRNPDSLNTIGIVVVGICGAVLVYVTIVALQAFYMNDTSDIQTMADYGGTDAQARSLRAAQVQHITDYGANPTAEGKAATYRVNIDDAMKLVVDAAKVDPSNLVPTQGRADKATIKPVFGRPQPLTAPADGAGAGSAAPADGAGAGSAAPAGAGSAAPAAPQTPTGGQAQGGSPATGGGTGSGGTGSANQPKANGP